MTVLIETDALREEASAPATGGAMLSPWACGLEDDAAPACDSDRCSDIMPELMVELI